MFDIQPIIHAEMVQGSDEWHAARCGLITAGSMNLILTPAKLQLAKNDKASSHVYELAAQRITKYVEPQYISDDMLRGMDDEGEARRIYSETRAPVRQVGLITAMINGVAVGYSPDGLVGDDGLIECKSRRQKYQIETIINGAVPAEHVLQIQTGLLVSARAWCDYISYCGGLPMAIIRMYPDDKVQMAIASAVVEVNAIITERMNDYTKAILGKNYPPTARVDREMFI